MWVDRRRRARAIKDSKRCPRCNQPITPVESWGVISGRVYHGECIERIAVERGWAVSDGE